MFKNNFYLNYISPMQKGCGKKLQRPQKLLLESRIYWEG